MIGITSYGAYIPRYRIKRDIIYSAIGWMGGGKMPGEKAIANYDEDNVTMAVAANMDCLNGIKRESIDGLYFATTAAPYMVRQNAGIIATALDIRPNIRTMDLTNSVKSGTSALLSAFDAVKAGSLETVMVCASDHRLCKAASIQEQIYGDGAATLLLGSDGVVASLEGSYSVSYDFMDRWRADKDEFERSWEERWIREEGYAKFIPEAIFGLLKKYNLNIKDFAKVIYSCPFVRDHTTIGKRLDADPNQIQDNMFTTVGDTGTAYPLMMLIAALEEAKPGDKIIVASYGNGSDALFFEVTERITQLEERRGISKHLATKKDLTSYEKYLVFSNLLTVEVGLRGEEIPPARSSFLWRDRRGILGLCGSRCRRCGTPQYPYQRICVNPNCKAIDEMEDYHFSDKKGYLRTYTADNLAFSLSPPEIYGMVDFEGGGRYYFGITDCDPDLLKVDMPLEMTFRKKWFEKSRGVYDYCWKAMPIRG